MSMIDTMMTNGQFDVIDKWIDVIIAFNYHDYGMTTLFMTNPAKSKLNKRSELFNWMKDYYDSINEDSEEILKGLS